jgi:hypothetical protein
MTVQTFKDLLTRKPFQPFRLIMSSGEHYDVRHPEMALLTRTAMYVSTDADKDGIPEEPPAYVSLLHVTAVEPIRNGRKARSRKR